MKQKDWAVLYLFPLAALLALAGGGCSEEPAIVVTNAQVSTLESSTDSQPLIAPSLAGGGAQFQQYCASCHTQANSSEKLEGDPLHMVSSEWIQQTTPNEMFTFLQQGEPEQGMPSFENIATGDRWNLVAYLLSLVSPQANVSSGKLTYQNLCQSCHGSLGKGDGTQAISQQLKMTNWQNQPLLPTYSNADLYATIQSGKEHGMSSFGAMLTDAQVWSLVSTVRTLSLTRTEANSFTQTNIGQSSSDADLSQNEGFFMIYGKVNNGSGGEMSNLGNVRLTIANGTETLQEMTAHVLQDGSFHFYLVPYHPAWSYVAKIDHEGVTYRSEQLLGESFASADVVPMTIQIYDAITDVSVLRGERLHALLNFQPNGTIHVTESLLVNNPSSYTVTSKDSETPLLSFKLGNEVQEMHYDEFSEDQSLQWKEGTLGDWTSILPGNVHQVLFEYDLPFKGDQTVEFDVPVSLASAMVMVENQTSDIACGGVKFVDRTSGESPVVLIFTSANVEAGGELDLRCYNRKNIYSVIVGIVVLVLALLGTTGIFGVARRKAIKGKSASTRVNKNTLLDAIITLDDQYRAGAITTEAYRAKREELIKKLEGE